jgi:phosphohistidine phosphatase SixA
VAFTYLVRHAKAGDREDWQGDDRLRPLSKSGWRQAEGLVELFEKFPVDRIVSSPYLRCVQTVEPLGRQRGVRDETTEALGEGGGSQPPFDFIQKFPSQNLVLCTHGDVVQEVVERLAADGVIRRRDAVNLAKGSTWRLEHTSGKISAAQYFPPP